MLPEMPIGRGSHFSRDCVECAKILESTAGKEQLYEYKASGFTYSFVLLLQMLSIAVFSAERVPWWSLC